MLGFADLPALGAGLGFRPSLRGDVFLHRDQIDFLEITADHYIDSTPEKEEELFLLRDHYTLIPHALNLSVGSADGIEEEYLDKLAGLVRRLDPPWWSEHLSFTRYGGIDLGHLCPLPFSREAVDVVCRNLQKVHSRIDKPLLLENISYLIKMPGAEMSEADFLAEVVERADCGILLDVTNLFANSANHRYDAAEFLTRLPAERIVQIHFVGGHWHEGFFIDSHSQATPVEVWRLMETLLSRVPVKGMVLERDENLPPMGELVAELARARHLAVG